MTRRPAGALGLVESPAQLLNVVELAHHIPDLAGLPIAVLAPKTGPTREQLRAMVALAREAGHDLSWYEPRLGLGAPRTTWALVGEISGVRGLVVGDPFSGLIQTLLTLTRPRPVTIVDDGTATLEFARLWVGGGPLLRWHRSVGAGAPQPLLGSVRELVAGTVRRRLVGGGLRIFTAMPVRLQGVKIVRNDYAWIRSRWPAPEVKPSADLVGTSLVETGVVQQQRYLRGVRSLVERYAVDRYFAHRKETEPKLDQIAALGSEVVLSLIHI